MQPVGIMGWYGGMFPPHMGRNLVNFSFNCQLRTFALSVMVVSVTGKVLCVIDYLYMYIC